MNKRTRAGRRAAALMQQFTEALGGDVTDGMKLAISRASVMTAIAEDARIRKLNGDGNVSFDDLVRLDRVAAQATKALGIGTHKHKPAAVGLGALLAQDRRGEGS